MAGRSITYLSTLLSKEDRNMKKLYDSPELEVLKFQVMEAVADDLSKGDGDVVDPDEDAEPFGFNP